MSSSDGAVVVSFNGEIYNYPLLRKELEDGGYRFESECDTEVLIHLYAKYGEQMVSRLRGMYAFVLWDARKGELLLARDPYGIKPLYYSDNGRSLYIASQVKALLAGGVREELDPAGQVGFFLLGSVPEPYTWHRAIRALEAGSVMRIGRRGLKGIKKHFSLAQILRESAGQTDLAEALRESVYDHLQSDVPVGVFLSSGVDSAAVVALGSERNSELRTLTLTFEEFRDTAADESTGAGAIARRYGTVHDTHLVGAREFEADLPLILEAMDQPSIDGLNTWFISKAAAARGLKVALSGLGADELLGGYPSFRDIPRWVKLGRLLGHRPGALGARMVARAAEYSGLINAKLAGLLAFAQTYAGAYLVRRGVFMPWELPQLLGEAVATEGLARLGLPGFFEGALDPDPGTPFGRVAALESSYYLRNQLLRDADWASMAHSVEIRTPFVDAVLLRKTAGQERGKGQGKAELASAPRRPLPPGWVGRPKTGFGVPLHRWLQTAGECGEWKRIAILRQRQCHWSRRWAYNVARFQRAA